MSKQYKIVVLGQSKAGKKQLINRLVKSDYTEEYKTTETMQLKSFRIGTNASEEKVFNFWVLGGPDRTMNVLALGSKDATLALYCVDLSADVDVATIKADLDKFREVSPAGKVILVGTKSDLVTHEVADAKTEIISSKLTHFDTIYITSAKNDQIIPKEDIIKLCDTPEAAFTTNLDLGYTNSYEEDVVQPPINPPNTPPFLKKHMNLILGFTASFAGAGAAVGAGLGVGMCVLGTVPTFGLSLLAGYAAIPLVSMTFAAAAAVVGLMVGLVAALMVEHNSRKFPFFYSPKSYLSEGSVECSNSNDHSNSDFALE